MRSESDIRSTMDYLTARDPNHPDLSAFRWVLSERKPEPSGDAALLEANKDMSRMIIEQDAQIKELKEKLQRFLRDGMVPKADFEATVQKRIATLRKMDLEQALTPEEIQMIAGWYIDSSSESKASWRPEVRALFAKLGITEEPA